MISVAALTAGKNVPSTRFRIRQHIELLKEHGIDVREFTPRIDKYALLPGWPVNISYKYALPYLAVWNSCKLAARLPGLVGSWRNSITWLEREILSGYLTIEYSLSRPLVLDADDAIWLSKPFGRGAILKISRRADIVVAGNQFLADWFSQWNQQVRIIPTAVDLGRYFPREPRNHDYASRFVIGWTGTAGNLKYLYEIQEPLRRFLGDYPSAELLIVADKAPVFVDLPAERVRFIPWSIEIEATSIHEMDVGIMPLPDDEWTRGKCSFKVLQYMACGIPIIASPVGMNSEVLALGEIGVGPIGDSEWYNALQMLYTNSTLAERMGRAGRSVTESTFSREIVTRQLAAVFKELV